MRLRISERLSLPVDWMTLATVIYGARGSGKTSLAAVFAEEVSKAGQRFCAIDLKGDLYGLKSTADGKGDGIPVVIFGGDHQDVPLEDGAGAFVGETVAGLGQSCVLDLEHFSKGKQVRFLTAFFEALYDRNRDPLLLILDEGQRYAPQRPIDPDAAKCLGAVEDLVKLGRKHGIGPVILTQRGSGLNKEVSELCDMLVAFRTPGPLDQDRVKDWLDANTTRVQRDEVMGQLAGLPTGTAVFASGHPDLKIFGVYPVRRRETFDSSATPKVGQRRKEPKRLAKPDLEELKSKMAAAIERQKADDPKALRARIAELEREVKAKPALVQRVSKTKRVEVQVISAVDRKLIKQAGDFAEKVAARATELTKAIGELAHCVDVATATDVSVGRAVTAAPLVAIAMGATKDRAVRTPPKMTTVRALAAPSQSDGDDTLSEMDRKFLTALAQYPQGLSKKKMLTITGYRDSGSVNGSLARLRGKSHVMGKSAHLRILPPGLELLGDWEPLPSGDELFNYWVAKLDKMPGEFLKVLRKTNGPTSKEVLLRATNYKDSGSVNGALALLRKLDLVLGGSDALMLNFELFT